MFDALSDRLQAALGSLTGRGRITEDDVNVAMREIRMALLAAREALEASGEVFEPAPGDHAHAQRVDNLASFEWADTRIGHRRISNCCSSLFLSRCTCWLWRSKCRT